MSLKPEQDIAMSAVRKAGALIRNYFHTNLTVTHKSPEQPVTAADREADALLKQEILGAFPNDGWLSEESVDDASRLHKKRVWIVDPLDGTKEFIAKVPEFAVSVGLAVDGIAMVGVVYNPIKDEIFSAVRGAGAFFGNQRISVSTISDFKQAVILASHSERGRGEWSAWENKCKVTPAGSLAYKIALVASARAEGSVSLQPKTEWDFCGGAVILEEAGGRISQLDGKPFIFNQPNPRVSGIAYGNPAIHQIILQEIQKQ